LAVVVAALVLLAEYLRRIHQIREVVHLPNIMEIVVLVVLVDLGLSIVLITPVAAGAEHIVGMRALMVVMVA
jgi:hypothetical protein